MEQRQTVGNYSSLSCWSYWVIATLLFCNSYLLGQSGSEIPSPVLTIDESFAEVEELTTYLEFRERAEENLTPARIIALEGWTTFSANYTEREEKGVLARFQVELVAAEPHEVVLYLHDLQWAEVLVNSKAGLQTHQAGMLQLPSERQMPRGLVVLGKGYSSQLGLTLQPGKNTIYLSIENYIRGPFRPQFSLYAAPYWREEVADAFGKSVGVHLLFIGALWIMAIYHLFIFVIRKDVVFFWYAMYTLVVSSMLMIESGVMQIYFTPSFPKINLLFRILLPHALVSYVVYWLFLRSFINLRQVLPKPDQVLRWFLLAVIIISVGMAVAFVSGLEGENYLSLKGIDYFIPITALIFGIVYFFIIIRIRDKLINLLLLGSFVLLLGVLTNTILSLGVFNGWWKDLPFPHFVITEVAVLFEIVVFALALGYRSQQAEVERLRVEQLNKLKSKFFANISHEFRTPLTVISGMANEIEGNTKAVSLIRRNSQSLLQLVNQLLDLSKLDAGLLQTNNTTRDIVSYLNYLTESFYSMAEEKGVRLNFYPESPELIMDFDEVRIQQIVSNLLSNALKFTPQGGKVIMHAREATIRQQRVLQLKVKDTGAGISKAEIPLIFDRFYQVDAGSTREGQGTGIGLSLTKELVELAEGSISVESVVGQWTEFTVILPAIQTGYVQTATEHPAPLVSVKMTEPETKDLSYGKGLIQTPSKEKDRLLIIEDNLDIITYLTELLSEVYHIAVARNGEEGIAMALEGIPDIIISDVMMPLKDGFEVCTSLKNDERTSHIPIVLLTAKAATEDRITGFAGGADAFLTKPFNKEELFVRLEKLLELRQNLLQRYSRIDQLPRAGEPLDEKLKLTKPSGNKEGLVLDLEDKFLRKVVSIIEQRIDDPELMVGDLTKAVGLSSMQVNRKLKALTGKTANALIRSIRLEKAKKLLLDPELNVSEIAYSVGFNDPNYFSRAFSSEFGISPGDYRK